MRYQALILSLPLALSLNAQQPKVLIIGIDGCRGDALLAANTPNLDGLIATGFSTFEGNTHPPTWSGTGWSTMLTGVWEQKHKVVDNSFADQQFATWPHFFARLHSVDPTLALHSIVHWAPINTQIVSSATQELELASDQLVADSAVALLENGDPDVLFLHFDDVDHAGHTYGFSPDIADYRAAIEVVDEQIGPVLAAVAARPANEQWMVMVSTDHGGDLDGHGGNSFEEQRIFTIASGPGIAAEERLAGRDTLIAPMCIELYENMYVRVNDATPYQFGSSQDFTIECNVAPGGTWGSDPVFVGNKNWNSGYNPGFVISTTGNSYEWKFNIGDGVDRLDLTGLPIADVQWHHLAVSCDRDGEATIFQDGLLLRSASMAAIGNIDNALGLCFGQDGTTTYPVDLPGLLSDVRIWNKALDINTISAWSGKTITPSHPDFAYLIGQWSMDEGSGGSFANAVSGAPDAQHYTSSNTSDAYWVSNTWPLITTDLSSTPAQADLVPTLLNYLCIANDPSWQLDGQALIPECLTTAIDAHATSPLVLFAVQAGDQLTIFGINGACTVVLHDASGRVLLRERSSGERPTINTSTLSDGLYLCSVLGRNGEVLGQCKWVKAR